MIPIQDDEDDERLQEISGITESLEEDYLTSQKSAINHFNSFLRHQNSVDSVKYSVVEYSKEAFSTPEVVSSSLDQFAKYLVDVVKIKKLTTTLQYLSKVKTKIQKDHKTKTIFGDGKWYKDIRSKVTSEYVKQCAAGGNKLVEHAAQLTDDDLTIMASLLFKRNDRQADKDRGILILQKQTIGRVSETSRLKYSNIKLESKTLPRRRRNHMVTLNRLKTGQQHEMNVFLHAHSWLLCPIHALGTLIVTASDPSEYIFSNIPEGSEASYVNRLLTSLYEFWSADTTKDPRELLTEHLSSHSARSGGAQDAQEHKDIQIQWVILRGQVIYYF